MNLKNKYCNKFVKFKYNANTTNIASIKFKAIYFIIMKYLNRNDSADKISTMNKIFFIDNVKDVRNCFLVLILLN